MITTKKYIIKLEYISSNVLSIIIRDDSCIIVNSKILHSALYDVILCLSVLYNDRCSSFYSLPITNTLYKYTLYTNFSFIKELYNIKIVKEKMMGDSIDKIIINEEFELYELSNLISDLIDVYERFGENYG